MRVAWTAVSTVPWPLIMITGRWAKRWRMVRSPSMPSMPGSQMSSSTRSTSFSSSSCSPSSAEPAVSGAKPSSPRMPERVSRMAASSSMMRMVSGMMGCGVGDSRGAAAGQGVRRASYQGYSGSSTVKTVPVGWLSRQRMVPPCSLTMVWAMARPSPVPDLRVEK